MFRLCTSYTCCQQVDLSTTHKCWHEGVQHQLFILIKAPSLYSVWQRYMFRYGLQICYKRRVFRLRSVVQGTILNTPELCFVVWLVLLLALAQRACGIVHRMNGVSEQARFSPLPVNLYVFHILGYFPLQSSLISMFPLREYIFDSEHLAQATL